MKLDLDRQLIVYAEAEAALGGETALQGEDPTGAGGLIVRNLDGRNFRRDRIDSRSLDRPPRRRRARRRPRGGDNFHSRHELETLLQLHLLTSATVVIHGTALEAKDFRAMKRVGARLVWSPLSNMLLYGHTTNVYDAIAAGVPVSLGTDWGPSGSKTLLDELKVADIALRSRRVLGASRTKVPALVSDKALDKALVDMVTRARPLRCGRAGAARADGCPRTTDSGCRRARSRADGRPVARRGTRAAATAAAR